MSDFILPLTYVAELCRLFLPWLSNNRSNLMTICPCFVLAVSVSIRTVDFHRTTSLQLGERSVCSLN